MFDIWLRYKFLKSLNKFLVVLNKFFWAPVITLPVIIKNNEQYLICILNKLLIQLCEAGLGVIFTQ